ncbi:unnamed protein product [Calicophoron daubneyi]|uniref:Uncharacterized protein n=1 Tax=Calicophoron daubneyi TaxID=300641 RepID=A0AAV2U0P5_CALDB
MVFGTPHNTDFEKVVSSSRESVEGGTPTVCPCSGTVRDYENGPPRMIGIKCFLYANDLKLWYTLRPEDSKEEMQQGLNEVVRWAMSMNYALNNGKMFDYRQLRTMGGPHRRVLPAERTDQRSLGVDASESENQSAHRETGAYRD